jgi:hypothetical protein
MATGLERQGVSLTSEQVNQAFPQITLKRVREEMLRCRQEIAHDLEEHASKYPPASGKTLSQIMTV